jgi:translation initiation factor eIF-2B subunit delta
MSMSMGNFIKFVRFTITQVAADVSEADAKDFLLERLYNFVEERISVAQQNIAKFCTSAIKTNDVILTFGSSPVIRQVLIAAAKVKTFKLIVVDARPLREGLKTVAALSPYVTCIYTPLASAATAMKEATKVILGASALLSNGSVFAPVGTAMVASLARFFRVPVIFAAETYKFCEKVQLDSIVYNEIGSCSELVRRADSVEGTSQPSNSAGTWAAATPPTAAAAGAPVPVMWTSYKGAAEVSELNCFPYEVINLRYDITPIQSVSVVATEAGMIPPTSVPVLIRELRLDQTGPAVTASIPGNQPTRK